MKMPFGKHKDQEIHTIPQDYLLWFRDNINNLHGDLLQAVVAGLDGKPYKPLTTKERVDAARFLITERLRQRDLTC